MQHVKFLHIKHFYIFVLFFLEFYNFVKCIAVVNDAKDIAYKKYLKTRTLPFEDCGSVYDILYLSISSCNSLPCVMRRGSTVAVNVIFDDEGNNTSFLKHRVHWIFNAIKTDATITPDPCNNNNNHDCIVSSSDGKSYLAALSVSSALPVLSGSMLWEAQNEYNENVICFKVPVVITTE